MFIGIIYIVVLLDIFFSDLGGSIFSLIDWIGFFYDDNGIFCCVGVG